MSEELESTQPNQSADNGSTKRIKPLQVDDTQPRKPVTVEDPAPVNEEQEPAQEEAQPVKKPSRWRSILVGILGFILLVGLGGFGGYNQGVAARRNAEQSIMATQLSEQFSFALVDIQFGRYENARQRLEYIIQHQL